jgi:RimJ/RimL family protein N-acetyltransferase
MSIATQLFEGKLVRLGPIDHDKDPEVESRWTHDISFLRAMDRKVAMPLSVAQMKKKYEAIEKDVDESKRLFYFAIRSKDDNRLLGYARIEGIEWIHGTGNLRLAIGDPAERGKGYGSDALQLVLNFAFREINLYRLSALVGGDNPGAVRFFGRHGFVEEVRRRKAILRDGQSFDLVHLGILRDEWLSKVTDKEVSHG